MRAGAGDEAAYFTSFQYAALRRQETRVNTPDEQQHPHAHAARGWPGYRLAHPLQEGDEVGDRLRCTGPASACPGL